MIAIAYKDIPEGQVAYAVNDERDLVLVGYIAFLAPPKETAKQAIAALNSIPMRRGA